MSTDYAIIKLEYMRILAEEKGINLYQINI